MEVAFCRSQKYITKHIEVAFCRFQKSYYKTHSSPVYDRRQYISNSLLLCC